MRGYEEGLDRPSEEEDFPLEDAAGQVLRRWLEENFPRNLSAAQISGHLVRQIARSGGELGEYLAWCLLPTEPRERKVRNLFPLRLWYDDVLHMQKALDEDEVQAGDSKKRAEGETRSQMQKRLRLEGVKTWHGLIVLSLNFQYGSRARAEKGPPPGSTATASQEAALTRLWDALKVFSDDKDKKEFLEPLSSTGPTGLGS